MVTAGNGSSEPSWALRDSLAAIGLFAASAAVILWQNSQVAVLWDLSYVLDTASRIALGQLPYRDFPLVHAPLTFLIQAAIIHFTGRVYFHQIFYMATVGGLSTVLAWRIVLRALHGRVQHGWAIAVLLAAPLAVLGIYCVFPFPSYDCDCACSILIAIYLLQTLSNNSSFLRAAATGAAICIPLFFKQNIGLPFLAVSVASILLLFLVGYLVRRNSRPDSTHRPHEESADHAPEESTYWPQALKGHGFSRAINTAKSTRALAPEASSPVSQMRVPIAALTGTTATLAASFLLIHFTVGLDNYIHWTIQFAAQRRLPGLADMLGVYRDPSLLWKLPTIIAGLLLLRTRLAKTRWAQFLAIAFLSAPFLFTLSSLLIYDDADERGDTLLALWPLLLILATALAGFNLIRQRRHLTLRTFLPIILLVAINGTLMSQQLWGSTYAIWPLLIILAADQFTFLAELASPIPIRQIPSLAIATVVSITLLVCGGFYTTSEERLTYVQLPSAPPSHSAFPQLAGMATPGPYLSDFDELLRYAQANIPVADGLILLPGEDPFYFATGRTPQFPVLLFDPATDPYSPAQLAEEVQKHQIHWLIVKRELQINDDPTPQREATLKELLPAFTLAAHLRAYDIYRR